MNIIEASRDGGPIRRQGWHDFLTVQKCPCANTHRPHATCPEPAYMFPDYVDAKLTPEDIIAEDWIAPGKQPVELLLDHETLVARDFAAFTLITAKNRSLDREEHLGAACRAVDQEKRSEYSTPEERSIMSHRRRILDLHWERIYKPARKSMSTEFTVYKNLGVELEVSEGGSGFSIIMESAESRVYTQQRLSPEELVEVAVKMIQPALYNVEEPEKFFDEVVMKKIKELFV